jgi:hypothetical protein
MTVKSNPKRAPRQLAAVIAVALMLPFGAFMSSAAAQSPSLEYPIKAAFLFKFGEFVQWPAQAFAPSSGTLNICVVGDSAFAAIVANAVQGETVAGRQVAAQALASIASSDPCHIAYLAGSPKQSVEDAIKELAGKPVLTVTDEGRGSVAGTIHFIVRNNRVRFAIDDQAAARNGLNLSSALLNIAVTVKRRN